MCVCVLGGVFYKKQVLHPAIAGFTGFAAGHTSLRRSISSSPRSGQGHRPAACAPPCWLPVYLHLEDARLRNPGAPYWTSLEFAVQTKRKTPVPVTQNGV